MEEVEWEQRRVVLRMSQCPGIQFVFNDRMSSRDLRQLDELCDEGPCWGCNVLPLNGSRSNKHSWCAFSRLLASLQDKEKCTVEEC